MEFPHSRYVPGTGGGAGGAAPPGWAEEGVGVLSKFRCRATTTRRADAAGGAVVGPNPRTALGVLAETPFGNLRVVAAHLSYDRRQQCDSVSTILRPWLDALWGREEALGQVLVGDLNTYPDYEWPLDALTLEPEILSLVGGPCAADAPLVLEGPPFVDAWARTRPLDSGATFPNPETMNLDVARPDPPSRGDWDCGRGPPPCWAAIWSKVRKATHRRTTGCWSWIWRFWRPKPISCCTTKLGIRRPACPSSHGRAPRA